MIELFNIGMPVVRTDGRAYGHVITKFSRIGRLPHFLNHGALLRALRARELRYDRLLIMRAVPTSDIMIIIVVIRGVFVVVGTPKNIIVEIFMISIMIIITK